jgi:hypothetical protein
LRDPNSGLLPFNPGGKVPTLQLYDGTILNETLLVLSYLDTQHGGGRLLPMDGSDGWRTLADTGRAIAFLDGISVWNRELRFGLKAPGVIAIESARAERVADALERALGEGHYQGPPNGSDRRGADRARRGARKHRAPSQGVDLAPRPAAAVGVSRGDRAAALLRRHRAAGNRALTSALIRS